MKRGWFIQGEEKITQYNYEVINQYTNEVIALVSNSSKEMMKKAIDCCQYAFPKMKALTSKQRADILYRAASIMEEEAEEIALIISKEAAKPITAARGEVNRTVQTLQFSAEEAKRMNGEYITLDAAEGGGARDAYTIYEPIGIVGAITPFNFPLNLAIHKVGPAIAVGNPIIVKPAEQTPLSSLYLADVLTRAGLPHGAIAVVPGEGKPLGEVLIGDDRIKKISFTGSPEVGKLIKSQAGLKKITLELGSNAALFVDESIENNLSLVVKQAVNGAFAYNGQVCLSTQRIYVHERIAKKFIEAFVQETKNVIFGDPLMDDTQVTCLISLKAQERILDWIKEATTHGAKVLSGGKAEGNGVLPTVLTNVKHTDKISCNEAFGPVVIIEKVKNSEKALALMNDSRFGLNAGIFSNNLQQALLMAHSLEVGQVLVNDVPTLRFDHMPYGGVKDSGYGREGVKYAVQEMSELKMISLNYNLGR